MEDAQISWSLALAAFGGFIRYIQRFGARKDERQPWEWGPFIVCTGTGAFAGLLTLWVLPVPATATEINHVRFAISLAGYGGPLTLDFAIDVAKTAISAFVSRQAQGGKDPDAKG